ncbi:hypothetical protein RRX38_24375 [Pseudomonas sp. DTU_2021_1001937_2_SI_NGA_ILE_001]|uniref:hypothetical protein n=1 Tax=Pseudomonas sp. DTU_2021_1001937_2_SI_NGA_ILE_001 TaxID=3077589 RepID=UPI0028FC1B0A|nr:hypothetical protein [Pseudomonas sp. DTU_2021_1001937_2_SI_NGA_ILE_001]WNW14157.1 hypothetical protein RRX38_24375 [Pseudomonas sp. DTU_2021_1001937_2_SI_NGA_ILE_001]
MATAILHSIRQGAYIAIALYVVFIAVITLTSAYPQLTDSQAPAVVHDAGSAQPVAQHTS